MCRKTTHGTRRTISRTGAGKVRAVKVAPVWDRFILHVPVVAIYISYICMTSNELTPTCDVVGEIFTA